SHKCRCVSMMLVGIARISLRLFRQISAVNKQVTARHERRVVTCKEGDGTGDFFWFPLPTQEVHRRGTPVFLVDIETEGLARIDKRARVDVSGTDCVYTDAKRCQVLCPTL